MMATARRGGCLSSLAVVMAITTMTSVVFAQIEADDTQADDGTMLIFLSGGDTDLRSTEVEVISGEARYFSGPSFRNMSSCLCGAVAHPTGWCYLGETVNGQKDAVNVSTVETESQALLKCSLYVTVGKSYLFCNTRVITGASNCRTLLSCASRTVAVVCSSERDCIAWCDVNSTAALRNEDDGEVKEGSVETIPKVTHHLSSDVIGVIATGGAVCAFFLVCCAVDKIRSSKWWILRHPKKRKLSKAVSEEFSPVSTLPSPPYHQKPSLTGSLTPSLVSHSSQGEEAAQRKQSKKRLKVQFRSVSLPSTLEACDSGVIIDQAIRPPDHRSGSYGEAPALMSVVSGVGPLRDDGHVKVVPHLHSTSTQTDSTKL